MSVRCKFLFLFLGLTTNHSKLTRVGVRGHVIVLVPVLSTRDAVSYWYYY